MRNESVSYADRYVISAALHCSAKSKVNTIKPKPNNDSQVVIVVVVAVCVVVDVSATVRCL